MFLFIVKLTVKTFHCHNICTCFCSNKKRTSPSSTVICSRKDEQKTKRNKKSACFSSLLVRETLRIEWTISNFRSLCVLGTESFEDSNFMQTMGILCLKSETWSRCHLNSPPFGCDICDTFLVCVQEAVEERGEERGENKMGRAPLVGEAAGEHGGPRLAHLQRGLFALADQILVSANLA